MNNYDYTDIAKVAMANTLISGMSPIIPTIEWDTINDLNEKLKGNVIREILSLNDNVDIDEIVLDKHSSGRGTNALVVIVTDNYTLLLVGEDLRDLSDVWLEEGWDELSALKGSVFQEFEEVEYRQHCEGEHGFEVQSWTYYKFRTDKGTATLRFIGSSNGYYADSVNVRLLRTDRLNAVLPNTELVKLSLSVGLHGTWLDKPITLFNEAILFYEEEREGLGLLNEDGYGFDLVYGWAACINQILRKGAPHKVSVAYYLKDGRSYCKHVYKQRVHRVRIHIDINVDNYVYVNTQGKTNELNKFTESLLRTRFTNIPRPYLPTDGLRYPNLYVPWYYPFVNRYQYGEYKLREYRPNDKNLKDLMGLLLLIDESDYRYKSDVIRIIQARHQRNLDALTKTE